MISVGRLWGSRPSHVGLGPKLGVDWDPVLTRGFKSQSEVNGFSWTWQACGLWQGERGCEFSGSATVQEKQDQQKITVADCGQI